MSSKAFPAIIATLVLTFVLAACIQPTPTAQSAATAAPPLLSMERSIPEIIKSLGPSVVHIQNNAVHLDQFNRPVPTGGTGTGEIIDAQGLVLTNNHVVAGAQSIVVTLSDGRDFEAEFIGGDPFTDLAVLRIEADGLVPIPIGESSNLQVGDGVIAIGHALNLPGGPTITGGWVSALDRSINISDTITMQHLIQTDAAINPGNSGGPLVNINGEMVGITTIKAPAGEGIGFAIAIDSAMPLIEELIAKGRIERGFLGIASANITEPLAINFNLPVTSGAGITLVAPGSPAEEAGLLPGDIIVGLAGKEVNNVSDLDRVLISYRSGTSVEVDFYRGDQKLRVTVTLGDRPR